MDIVSFPFLLFALAAILLLRACPLRYRPGIILVLNAGFVASFLHTPADSLPILSMLALGYSFTRMAACKPSRAVLSIMVAIIVLYFIWLKHYTVLATLLPSAPLLTVVGLSYILFRVLHLLIDVAQGVRPAPSPLAYVNYCLFFPSFLSGPIARYEQFAEGMARPFPPLTVPRLHHALCRIALGLLMLVVISAYASTAIDFIKTTHTLATPDHHAWVKTAELFSLVSFFVFIKLYTNFCGSMHIVIGIASLAGFTLPENFNKPYLAKNFLDFWARWHITLSEWIKFYLFNPLLTALTKRFPSRSASTAVGAVAFFIAFFVIGMWHGTTAAFAVFGIMLGIGAVTNKLWQQFLGRVLGKPGYKSLLQRNWYFQFSRALTLSYIAIALLCLWVEPGYIATNGVPWLLALMLLSLLMMTTTLTVAGTVIDLLNRPLAKLHMPRTQTGSVIMMTLLLWVVINHLGAYGSGTPELVYKGF